MTWIESENLIYFIKRICRNFTYFIQISAKLNELIYDREVKNSLLSIDKRQ